MYSLETRIKALAVAGMMAASVAGSAVTAFAADPTTITEETEASGVPVQKTVQVADGITLPEKSMGFAATFSQSSVAGVTSSEKAPKIKDLTLTFAEGASGATLTQTGNIALKDEFKDAVPGEYVYTLTETTQNDLENGYGWTCNPGKDSYVLRVYVDSSKGVKYTILKSTDDNDQLDNAGANDKKLDKASFSNIYTKRGGSNTEGDPSLKVNKTVMGEYGDVDQYFKFTVTFDVPDTDQYRNNGSNTFKMTFTGNDDGKYINETKQENEYDSTTGDITLTDNGSYVFYLKNGGSVSFDDLPAGTYYTLSETGYNGYTAKLTTVENGGDATVKKTGSEGEGVSEERILIGEKTNSASIENTYKSITITGVVTHSAPFVIMVGALFVAVGGYVVLKKRIEE